MSCRACSIAFALTYVTSVLCAQVKILATAMQMLSLFSNDDSYPVSSPPAYAEYIASASSWACVERAANSATLHPLRL